MITADLPTSSTRRRCVCIALFLPCRRASYPGFCGAVRGSAACCCLVRLSALVRGLHVLRSGRAWAHLLLVPWWPIANRALLGPNPQVCVLTVRTIVDEEGACLECTLTYPSSHVDEEVAERWLDALQACLEDLAAML